LPRANARYAWNYQINVFAFKPGAGIAKTYIDARTPPLHTLALKLEASAPLKMRVVDPSGTVVQNGDALALKGGDSFRLWFFTLRGDLRDPRFD